MGRKSGSITVFLSLTGILIMALLGTLLETARYTACANHAARTTQAAVDALLAEYNRPLYDHYGLFFIESAGPAYDKVIADYAGDTLEAARTGDLDFFQGELRRLSVSERVYVGDNGAEALQKEITEYMKRREIEKQWKKFTNKSKELSEQEKAASEIEKSVEEQKEEAELDEQLIELMELVDGITVSRGKISCGKEFIKMFVTGKKECQRFGITNAKVWEKMSPRLDDTPMKNFSSNRGEFFKHVKHVLKMTDRAIEIRNELRDSFYKIAGKNAEFAEHDAKLKELLKNMSVLETNREILRKTSEILTGKWTGEKKDELIDIWTSYDTESIVFDYTGVEEKGGADSPLDALSSSWDNGILNLVCENISSLSQKKVKNVNNYAKLYKEEKQKEVDYGKRVENISKEEVELSGTLGNAMDVGLDEFCLDAYIEDRFSSYVHKVENWEGALTYQREYLVAGKGKDRDNLEAVLNRILLIRTVTNFGAIFQDSAKREEAYAAAAAVVGFTGMEPLIRLTQTLILIVWALVESLVDIAGLLQKRDVPIVKSPKQILTGFADVFVITNQAICKRAKKFHKAAKNSFGYREYLTLFLVTTKASTRRYRIMDLIQWNMRNNGYRQFDFGTCVFSIRVQAGYAFPAKFFRMAVIERMLGRDVREYTFLGDIVRGYL